MQACLLCLVVLGLRTNAGSCVLLCNCDAAWQLVVLRSAVTMTVIKQDYDCDSSKPNIIICSVGMRQKIIRTVLYCTV